MSDTNYNHVFVLVSKLFTAMMVCTMNVIVLVNCKANVFTITHWYLYV